MGSDMRILVPACRAYFYPDVVLTCAEPVFQDEEQDTILNPTVLIEILSKSTEKLDRERKFDCYRLLPTLTTYVLVSQEQARIEVYQRDGEEWRFMPLLGRDQSLTLPMLTSPLSFESIYARVKFGEEE
jgi:Uma2 family endonuclease